MIPTPPLPLSRFTQEGVFLKNNKDPINLLFAFDSIELVLDLIESDPLWCQETLGVSNQVFGEPATPKVWHTQDINRATKIFSGASGRFHVRGYSLFEEHPSFGRLVAAGIHKESWRRCGWRPSDVVSPQGFDEGRDHAIEAFVGAGYGVVEIDLGPSGPIEQCNHDLADTDGYAALIGPEQILRARGLPLGWTRPLRHA